MLQKIRFLLVLMFLCSFSAIAQDKPASAEHSESEKTEQAKDEKDESGLIIIDDKSLPWISGDEAEKSEKNLARLTFPKDSESPVNDDIIAIKSMIKLIEQDKVTHIIVKSYSSKLDNETKEKQTAIRRSLALVKLIVENGFPEQNISLKIYSSKDNSSGLDYIDIDKI